jgi:HEPN domain-containing protein
MPQTHRDHSANSDDSNMEEIERLLEQGVSLAQDQHTVLPALSRPLSEDDEENEEVSTGSDVQGAIGLYAEAAQDMATAGLELGLGRHFACADFCNQAVEKAAQAVSLLRFGRRTMYDHDLGALGGAVGAPPDIQAEMATLTPFHPEAFYVDTPPEEADQVISAEQAATYVQRARRVLRWAKSIVLEM